MPENPVAFPRTLDQLRAAFAWAKVHAVSQADFEEYHTQVRSFPVMAKTEGLGQAIAFLYAGRHKLKAKGLLLNHLQEWLCTQQKDCPAPIYGDVRNGVKQPSGLLERLTANNSATMRRADAEAQELCHWLKRFAEGRKEEAAQSKTDEREGGIDGSQE